MSMVAHRSPAKKNTAEAKNRVKILMKKMPFSFKINGQRFNLKITVGDLRRLPSEAKLLLAYGQVHDSTYSFYDTEEKCFDYAQRIVNKALKESETLSSQEVRDMINESIEKGYMSVNGKGPELTGEGLEQLAELAKQRRMKPTLY